MPKKNKFPNAYDHDRVLIDNTLNVMMECISQKGVLMELFVFTLIIIMNVVYHVLAALDSYLQVPSFYISAIAVYWVNVYGHTLECVDFASGAFGWIFWLTLRLLPCYDQAAGEVLSSVSGGIRAAVCVASVCCDNGAYVRWLPRKSGRPFVIFATFLASLIPYRLEDQLSVLFMRPFMYCFALWMTHRWRGCISSKPEEVRNRWVAVIAQTNYILFSPGLICFPFYSAHMIFLVTRISWSNLVLEMFTPPHRKAAGRIGSADEQIDLEMGKKQHHAMKTVVPMPMSDSDNGAGRMQGSCSESENEEDGEEVDDSNDTTGGEWNMDEENDGGESVGGNGEDEASLEDIAVEKTVGALEPPEEPMVDGRALPPSAAPKQTGPFPDVIFNKSIAGKDTEKNAPSLREKYIELNHNDSNGGGNSNNIHNNNSNNSSGSDGFPQKNHAAFMLPTGIKKKKKEKINYYVKDKVK